MKKCLIICVSAHTKSTQKLADCFGEVLNAKVVNAKELQNEVIDNYDFIGFGSGIYYFRHNPVLLKLAENLPSTRKKAFIFSTHGFPLSPIFHRTLRKILKEKGFTIDGEFSCAGKVNFGPFKVIGGLFPNHPTQRNLENARRFAKKLLK